MRNGNLHRVVVRVRSGKTDDFVASATHYPSKPSAERARQALLVSPSIKCCTPPVGVLVMHWTTFKRLVDEGSGVEIKTLTDNVRRFGWNVANASKMYKNVADIAHLLEGDRQRSHLL